MPPVAPSPHRFVSAKQRKASPTKETRPPPVPRQRTPPRGLADYVAPQLIPTSGQFASTPRFSVGKSASRDPSERPRSPVKAAAVYSLKSRAFEDVIDASPENNKEDEEMLDNARDQVLPTTEEHSTGPNWTESLPYSPKKRRLDNPGFGDVNPATAESPARPSFKHPQTPASQLSKPAPRFTAPPQTSYNTSIDEELTQHRPAFLRPSVTAQTSNEPLPEAFSPHRRGQKFIPGGMAAMVQQWVIDTGQAAAQSRRGQAHARGDDFVVRVKMVDVKGDGPLVGSAQLASGEAVNVLLTHTTGPLSLRSADVKEGAIVGIRAPTWEVKVGDRSWTVGVDWKVMS